MTPAEAKREDLMADALEEMHQDAEWARHDTHRDCGDPFDDECLVCLTFYSEDEE